MLGGRDVGVGVVVGGGWVLNCSAVGGAGAGAGFFGRSRLGGG